MFKGCAELSLPFTGFNTWKTGSGPHLCSPVELALMVGVQVSRPQGYETRKAGPTLRCLQRGSCTSTGQSTAKLALVLLGQVSQAQGHENRKAVPILCWPILG